MTDRAYIIQEIRKLFKENQDIKQRADRAREIYSKITNGENPRDINLGGEGDNMTINGKPVPKEYISYILGQTDSVEQGATTEPEPSKGAAAQQKPEPKKKVPEPKAGPAKGKIMPAKDAVSTKDHPFQEATVGDDFPRVIIPGMDRGDRGFGKKDASRSINSAAIKILGSDPRKIYTALINSGVIQPNYKPKSDFSDLRGLIAKFQERAINGLLRYQKKMKISAKDAEKRLSYKPTVKTQDLRTKRDPELRDKMLADRPGVTTEQKAANVAVDGKIGSRTAKLLLIYADPKKFEDLKKKAGVVPPKKVVAPKEKPEKDVVKKRSDCRIEFEDVQDIRDKTILTLKGFNSCAIGNPKVRRFYIGSTDFTDVSGYIGGGKIKDEAYKLTSRRLGKKIKKIAAEFSNLKDGSYYKNPEIMNAFDFVFSDIFVKFYSGRYDNESVIIFAVFDNSVDEPKAIAYKTSGGQVGDSRELLRKVTQNNKFLSLPRNKRYNSIKGYNELSGGDAVNIRSIQAKAEGHIKILDNFFAVLRSISKRSPQRLEGRYGKGASEAIRVSMIYINTYRRRLADFIGDLNSFTQTPSDETLSKLNLSASTIGGVQFLLLHGGKSNDPL